MPALRTGDRPNACDRTTPPEPLDVPEDNRRHTRARREDEGLKGRRPSVIEAPDCRRTGERQELRRAVSPIGRKRHLLQVGCRAERRRTRPADEEGDTWGDRKSVV